MLMRVLYVSVIKPGLTNSDFERLVNSSRRRNRQLDLTGALLVCDGHFVQVLEGDADAVAEMMAKIERDRRHHCLRVEEKTQIQRRLFAHWDMAFVNDSRCNADVHDFLDGRTSSPEFLEKLAVWIEEQRESPV